VVTSPGGKLAIFIKYNALEVFMLFKILARCKTKIAFNFFSFVGFFIVVGSAILGPKIYK
ncbi:hypothetical protein C2G38_2083914, partial [Gigaspora rosea]